MENSGIIQKVFEARLTALRVTVIYVIFGGAWILFSDQLLGLAVVNPTTLTQWQMIKGWLFIIITAGLLYGLIQRGVTAINFQKTLFECLSEATLDGILVVSNHRRWLYCNQRFMDMWQYPSTLFKANSSKAGLHWIATQVIDSEVFLARVNYLYKNPDESTRDEIRHIDGRIFDRYSTPIKSKEGIHYGRVWFYRDITARRQNEETLRETTEKLQALIQASPLAIYALDLEGVVTLWNPACERVFGWSESEVLGHHLPIVPPENLAQFQAMRQRVLQGETLNGVEVRRRQKNGSPVDISLSTAVLTDAHGNINGVISVAADITQRKQAEAALRLSEERFAKAFHSNPAAMIIAHLADGRIIDVNESYQRLLGYSRTELIGRTGLEMNVFTNPAERDKIIQQFQQHGSVRNYETTASTKSGTTRQVLLSIEMIELEGEPCLLSLLYDITDRQEAEAALRQSEERLHNLHEIDKAILLAHSPQEIARAALNRIRHLIPCQRASVTLFDREVNEMLILAADVNGATALHTGVRQPLQPQRLTELGRGQALLVQNILALTEMEPVIQTLKSEGIRSYLDVPLIIQAELIGSLNLAAGQPDAFRPEHVAIAREVADQLAIALHNANLLEQVHRGHEQLRNLAGYLQAVREEERTRIARDLHDEFGQALTALKMDIAWLSKRLPAYATTLHHKTGMMSSLIDTTLQLVRRVSAELRPGVLDDLGLVAAIEWQVQEFTARTGIQCELCLSEPEISLGRDLSTAVFRIFQEILTNVTRHAQASHITAELLDHSDELILIVCDNGRGITPEQLNDPKSLGLMGMRERANSWGGTITFCGVAGEGTTVTLCIPHLKATEEYQAYD